jgi:hypothetical protein
MHWENNTILCNQVRTKILSALKWETLKFKRSMSPILRLIIYNIQEYIFGNHKSDWAKTVHK